MVTFANGWRRCFDSLSGRKIWPQYQSPRSMSDPGRRGSNPPSMSSPAPQARARTPLRTPGGVRRSRGGRLGERGRCAQQAATDEADRNARIRDLDKTIAKYAYTLGRARDGVWHHFGGEGWQKVCEFERELAKEEPYEVTPVQRQFLERLLLGPASGGKDGGRGRRLLLLRSLGRSFGS